MAKLLEVIDLGVSILSTIMLIAGYFLQRVVQHRFDDGECAHTAQLVVNDVASDRGLRLLRKKK
jgi:hypothetical protein